MRNFLKIDRPLSWSFTQNFKERYHHKRKESQVSNLKSCLPEEPPKEKSAKDLSKRRAKDVPKLNLSIFLTDLSGLEKLQLPLRDYMEGYFWQSLGETFLRPVFTVWFFFSPMQNAQRKNPAETQSMKIQVTSGEILVHKNVGKIMQNVDSPSLALKPSKLAWHTIVKSK